MGETACGPHQAPLAEEQPSSSCVSPSPEQPASRRSLRRALSSLHAPSFLDQRHAQATNIRGHSEPGTGSQPGRWGRWIK